MAVSCSSQAQLTDAERIDLLTAAKRFGGLVQAGNADAVKAAAVPTLVAQFGPIAGEISAVSSVAGPATLTVVNLFALDASDLKEAEDETQFFCGGPNSPEVIFSLPRIPPGKYALAILHATGIAQPKQLTLILAQGDDLPQAPSGPGGPSGSSVWKLAGLFSRPLTVGGKDGLWYWVHARSYAQARQNWNAYFYYEAAASLLAPVNFLSSPNLDKLLKEQSGSAPGGLPGPQPMVLSASGHTYSVTALSTDGSLGGLDLVVSYVSPDNSDPVAARSRNFEVMQAILSQHPELRQGFHGLWVYANAADQRAYANELPMSQIP